MRLKKSDAIQSRFKRLFDRYVAARLSNRFVAVRTAGVAPVKSGRSIGLRNWDAAVGQEVELA